MEICRQVIAMVHNNGGHFLAKESGSNQYWTCMSEDRIVAKTNQALREGAPKIREAFQGGKRAKMNGGKRSFRMTPPPTSAGSNQSMETPSVTTDDQRLEHQLPLSQFVSIIEPSPEFRPVEMNEPDTTSTMMLLDPAVFRSGVVSPTHEHTSVPDCPSDVFGDLLLAEAPPALPRRHSLVLSDISPHPNYLQEDFQNPFVNESWLLDAGMGTLLDNSSSSLQRGVSSTLPMEFLSI